MPAACSVEMKPQIMALGPMRAIRQVREDARAESTPIWMPSEPRFANPHSAYDAMVKPRVESASFEAISAFRSRYAANSFSTSLVASSSETRRISDRGTPVWRGQGGAGVGVWQISDEKCDGVEDVAQDELQSEVVDPEAATDPGEQTVDGPDEGQEREHVAENLACNDETQDGTLGTGMQCVHGCVLGVLATVNDDSPTRHGLLQFWHADLADGDRRRNTHDRGSDKVRSRDTHAYVSVQDGASDGGESLKGSALKISP